ncbi:hypothetical protein PHYBOEH_000295 [Phytophthora boehmeriae]|uniref:Uncharacterized protein n=1 Tax=Phytophthora boehmeriae TaxID=109152 RepID=A0A8T1VEU8_9STRA|nr:hypothetical protein PHYBOEH_000295 [Phytophthora boehmeriae]
MFWKKPLVSSENKEEVVEAKVSFMLIQVKNRSPKDSGFSQSATKKLCPWFVFKDENTLVETPIREIIRIYMNVGEEQESKCFQFIYSSSFDHNTPEKERMTTEEADKRARSKETNGKEQEKPKASKKPKKKAGEEKRVVKEGRKDETRKITEKEEERKEAKKTQGLSANMKAKAKSVGEQSKNDGVRVFTY